MKLLFLHLAEKQASFRYRVAQYKQLWEKDGYQVTFQPVVGLSAIQKIQQVLAVSRYDAVILQKKLLHPFLIRAIIKRSRLIYDFDDALYARESYKTKPPRSVDPGSRTSRNRLNYILRHAHAVWAGNRVLAEYSRMFNNHVHIIPTALPRVNAPADDKDGLPLRIGWIGNTYNLYYLKQVDEFLHRVYRIYPTAVEFHLMSGRVKAHYFKTPWVFTQWHADKERDWLKNIDVGIMPLNDDDWSRGKCAFKLLQYARYGNALIASDVGANREVIRHNENGFLINRSCSWEQAIRTLVENPSQVSRMGRAAQEHFLNFFELKVVYRQLKESVNLLFTR